MKLSFAVGKDIRMYVEKDGEEMMLRLDDSDIETIKSAIKNHEEMNAKSLSSKSTRG